jgi:neutral ceramidase
VAAFASSNLGDVSPNTKGPHCIDNGEECNMHTSTCDGANVLCVASGPGQDMFESTKIIGERLSAKALVSISNQINSNFVQLKFC